MTGPDPGAYERGTGAPPRSTGTQGAVGAILIVLALGLALRLFLLYLLPGSGFGPDLGSFRFWANDLATNGVAGFYQRDFFHDYTPGYLYVLWVVGTVGRALGGIGDLIKIPPILADLGIAYLVWSMVRELGARDRLALAAAGVVLVNPILWFDNVVWGQVDSFGVVFLLLGLRALWRDQPERAAVFAVIAAVIKPQLGILLPIVAVVTIRRALRPVPRDPDVVDAAGPFARLEARTGHPLRIATTAIAGYLAALALCLPFGLSVLHPTTTPPFVGSGLLEQVALAGGGYPYLSVNAYNVWAIVPGDTGLSLAGNGQWVCDAAATPADRCGAGVAQFGAIPAVAVGATLLVVAILGVLWAIWRHPDRLTITVGLAVVALVFFALPTRVHERYGFPFFSIAAILIAFSPRWRVAYLLLGVATFANMYVVPTTIYPPADPTTNPIRDWFDIGPTIRSTVGVTAVALVHTVGTVWAWVQLRARARERLEEELYAASSERTAWDAVDRETADPALPPGVGAPLGSRPVPLAAGPTLPTWTESPRFEEVGVMGWLADRLGARPTRADRSATLDREGGGRLDRLDVWLVVVLVVASFGLRTFRLAEPYQMHFDEVYHARTATEFLQAWRYDESHAIYEWTHPHLAKYVMAGGLVLWGGDHVRATGELGTPVRAAAVEPRRDDEAGRAGERLHIATGAEVRTEDLRTRRSVASFSAPGVGALALDPTQDRLLLGTDEGVIQTVDLALIGEGDTSVEPVRLATVQHPVAHLLVADDGTLIAASDGALSTIDGTTGEVLGTAEFDGIADLAPGGSGPVLQGDPAAIEDSASVAEALAGLIGGDPLDYESRIGRAAPGASVLFGSPGSGETRTAVEEAIADGRLPGIAIVDLPRVAVATSSGVSFIDPASAATSTVLPIDGGAHGMDIVTRVEDTQLYVSGGSVDDPTYHVLKVSGAAAASGPIDQGSHPLPGLGSRVAYDTATRQVHILGLVPEGRAGPDERWTVYVIEPHAKAVYADARLPDGFTPATWVMDVEPEYQSEDRQELIVLDADGSSASIDVGSHAFAWRLPGVIAGVLMAACLYVLARILFARRSVAVAVGGLTLVEGMFFVQSRIGMNDVYVGLFIVAAYTVFAAVWTGWWRSRWALWVAMPVVGLLLGLALASKWVAAYAIGALVLLLLSRSALGRVVAILGLIALTGTLGYLAMAGGTFGNVPFLVLMIGLTLAAVVVAVFHPIRWSDEEMWLALAAPAAIGAVLFFGALALGRLDAQVVVGPVAITPLLAAIAASLGSLLVYAAFRVGEALGYGPLAPPIVGRQVAPLEPPAPAPTGWLRPGWAAGLPLVWAAVSLVAIPLAVYVASYLPWAAIENHRLWDGYPAGHAGQTLLDLTRQMYDYHNGLTSPHPASSPWWAFPFDLKPVWFYQEGYAGNTTGAIYDSGNLVIWWLGIAALAFVTVMAYRRRSPALALIAIGFAGQWVPWARIDRAAFQYHYFTALPFVILALAYLLAELWHGPSRRTWMAARIAAALAIIAPAAMWLLSRPLCALVGVTIANPGSQACPALIPDVVLTVRTLALLGVLVAGGVVAWLWFSRLGDEGSSEERAQPLTPRFLGAVVAVAFGVGVASLLPDSPLLTWRGIPVEPIALLVLLPLLYLAGQVIASRDARRFVVGVGVAVVTWFTVWYPNLSALPLPSTVVNAYQGLLPTYLYAFQFPVNTAARPATPLLSPVPLALTLAVGVTCLVVAYSASVWRLALAESRATSRSASGSAGRGGPPGARSPSADGNVDGLARTGGDA